MVEDSGLRGASRPDVVMTGDRVQQLGGSVQCFEQPEPEVDMAEQSSFVGRGEDRWWAELTCTADVVDERRGEQQIGA